MATSECSVTSGAKRDLVQFYIGTAASNHDGVIQLVNNGHKVLVEGLENRADCSVTTPRRRLQSSGEGGVSTCRAKELLLWLEEEVSGRQTGLSRQL